ncbi:zinc-binding dehydrogenase [Nakamurella lactea]|uniref:zinc-binding dehydrogenase n=1 Tax=Nakamurella lactea TaxID=459515 RepID=UPI0003FD5803|nr:zinc-binding dehydrogenase [Nakamurella lactea]
MHAIRLHAFGPAENLVLDELPDLIPAAGQLRIAVGASGVHLIDTKLRSGDAGPMPRPELPTIPGREVAGTVDLIGYGVDESWLGRRVVAHLGQVPGGYAEQAVTAVENAFPVPADIDLADAVAAVGTGRTALAVLELDPIDSGDTVLVPSAAGGMGWLLVQAAKEAGATVVAAARGADKVDRLAALRPDLVVDYGVDGWGQSVRDTFGGVSLVYDGVGGQVGRASMELLRPGGRLVMFGFSAGTPTRFDSDDVVRGGISVSWRLGPAMQSLPGGSAGLAGRSLERLTDGRWQPLVSRYPLADAARAHRDLEQRRAVGKVVLISG